MNEWGVVLVIAGLVSLALGVNNLLIKPAYEREDKTNDTLNEINSTLVKLNTTLDFTREEMKEIKEDNKIMKSDIEELKRKNYIKDYN